MVIGLENSKGILGGVMSSYFNEDELKPQREKRSEVLDMPRNSAQKQRSKDQNTPKGKSAVISFNTTTDQGGLSPQTRILTPQEKAGSHKKSPNLHVKTRESDLSDSDAIMEVKVLELPPRRLPRKRRKDRNLRMERRMTWSFWTSWTIPKTGGQVGQLTVQAWN
jgi:hypothetical protein